MLVLAFALLSTTSMPARYRAIMGPATNHIVMPLPSGVMTAPNMTRIIAA